MVDTVLNPTTPVTNGGIVTTANPLPVTLTGGAPVITNYTWASVPTPTSVAGKIVFVSNFGTKGSLLVSDGTRWKPVGGSTVLATLDTVSSNITNSAETIVFQYQIPAGVLQTLDRLRLAFTMIKSGTTDTGTINIRMGTAGTTSDTSLTTWALLSAANRAIGIIMDFRLASATTIQQLGDNNSANASPGYSSTAAGAFAGPVTITSAAANALFFNVGIVAGGASNTVAVVDAQLQLISSAN